MSVSKRSVSAKTIPAGLSGERSSRLAGPVLLINGFGNFLRRSFPSGIKTANDSLQIGKFPDQVRRQVGLGQADDLPEDIGSDLGIGQAVDGLRQREHLVDLLPITTEFLMKNDRMQAWDPLVERFVCRRPPRKTRHRSTGPSGPAHALCGSKTFVVTAGVHHGKEARQQDTIRILDCKILLVLLHHRDQDFTWQGQETLLEFASRNSWILVDVDDLFEKFIVGNNAAAQAR